MVMSEAGWSFHKFSLAIKNLAKINKTLIIRSNIVYVVYMDVAFNMAATTHNATQCDVSSQTVLILITC